MSSIFTDGCGCIYSRDLDGTLRRIISEHVLMCDEHERLLTDAGSRIAHVKMLRESFEKHPKLREQR